MKQLEIFRDNNLLIKNRNLNIYINDILVDTMPKGVSYKKINLKESDEVIYINSGIFFSNKLNLSRLNGFKLKIGAQIDNTLYLFLYGLFFLSLILYYFKIINEYIGIAMILPMFIIVYHQTIGRKKLYILSNEST